MASILVVDDNEKIVNVLTEYLKAAGHKVFPAVNGKAALALARMQRLDLALVDIMLPGADGYEITEAFQQKNIPTILITAKTLEEDRIKGLELGADDYITKPFSPREVVARVEALLRRIEKERSQSNGSQYEEARRPSRQALTANSFADSFFDAPVQFDNLAIDPVQQVAKIEGADVGLTHSEYVILCQLAQDPGRVFTREQLMHSISRDDASIASTDTRSVDAHVKNLRRKLGESPRNAHYIQTVVGSGYRFNPNYRE